MSVSLLAVALEIENFFITDGSFMPTGGRIPCPWIIYANAFRVADKIKQADSWQFKTMFELLLMRHAKSDWSSHSPDIDRSLNQRGENDACCIGKYLQQINLIPDTLVVSAAQRTQQTAQLLCAPFSANSPPKIVDKDLYLADYQTLLDTIHVYAKDNQCLLIVAHNPGMDNLVSYLSNRAPPLSDTGKLMTTCAIAHFKINTMNDLDKPGQAELQQLLRAKEIATKSLSYRPV